MGITDKVLTDLAAIAAEADRKRDAVLATVPDVRDEAALQFRIWSDADSLQGMIKPSRQFMDEADCYLLADSKDYSPWHAGASVANAYGSLYRALFVHAAKRHEGFDVEKLCTAEDIFTEAAGAVAARTIMLINRGRPSDAGKFLGSFVGNLNYLHSEKDKPLRDGIIKALAPLVGQIIVTQLPTDMVADFMKTFKTEEAEYARRFDDFRPLTLDAVTVSHLEQISKGGAGPKRRIWRLFGQKPEKDPVVS